MIQYNKLNIRVDSRVGQQPKTKDLEKCEIKVEPSGQPPFQKLKFNNSN